MYPMTYGRPQELVFTVREEPVYLFDAAYSGNELTDEDRIIININPSSYTIDTASYEPDDNTSLILHRFVPIKE